MQFHQAYEIMSKDDKVTFTANGLTYKIITGKVCFLDDTIGRWVESKMNIASAFRTDWKQVKEKVDLTLGQIRQANLARQDEYQYAAEKPTQLFWATAIAGEVGELCNFIKKEFRDGVDNQKAIEKELADILTYLDLLAASRNINLASVYAEKFNAVSEKLNLQTKIQLSSY